MAAYQASTRTVVLSFALLAAACAPLTSLPDPPVLGAPAAFAGPGLQQATPEASPSPSASPEATPAATLWNAGLFGPAPDPSVGPDASEAPSEVTPSPAPRQKPKKPPKPEDDSGWPQDDWSD